MSETNLITDELINKIYHLTKNLDKAYITIEDLKKENIKLQQTINNLKNNETI